MEDEGFVIATILISTLIGLVIGFVIGGELSHTDEIGQMICDEKAIDKPYALEYNRYNSDTKTVVCKRKHVERFDGGYVQISG
jgi:hypothetical protein